MKYTIAVAAAAFASLGQAASIKRSTTVSGVEHTFYGEPDNSPPGAGIAYDCGRGYTAGGTGTYDDPLTFATAPGEFDKCEVVYDTYTHKYLRFEDTCEQCTTDFNNDGTYHIDIFTGSNTSSGGQDQINCEDELTPDGGYDVIRQPGDGQDVNSGPLYDGSCHPENTYPNN